MKNNFEGKNVLITGGLGFIGSNLAHRLVDLDANVSIVDALIPGMGGNVFNVKEIEDKIEINIGDLRDESITQNVVKGKDYIFNLAAQLSHTNSMSDPLTDLDINCKAHLILLESCRKYNDDVKIIYTGTRGQYGKILYNPVDEKHPINPTDANGITKHACEQYHLLYHNIYGIKTTSLRLTNTYGPRHQMQHSKQGFIGWFARLLIDNMTVKIFGDGKQMRDFTYVDDVVSAMLMSAESKKTNGDVFNLSGSKINVIDLVKMMVKIVEKGKYELVPFPKESEKIEIGDYFADAAKIKRTVDWEPKIGIEDGLKRMVKFYERNKSNYW